MFKQNEELKDLEILLNSEKKLEQTSKIQKAVLRESKTMRKVLPGDMKWDWLTNIGS